MKIYKILIGALCLGACTGCGSQEVAETVVEETPVVYENVLEVDGEVIAEKTEDLYIDFVAKIKEVNVKEGEVLSKDQPLFTLDTTTYEDEIKLKKQNIAVMEAEIRGMELSANPLTAEIAGLKEELSLKQQYESKQNHPDIEVLRNTEQTLQRAVTKLQDDYDKNKLLYENGAVSEQTLTDIADDIKNKQEEIKKIQNQIKSIQDQNALGIANLEASIASKQIALNEEDRNAASKLEVAKLKLQVAKDELAILQKQCDGVYLKDHQLLSSKDQLLVYDIQGEVGMPITNSAQLLARCVDLSSLLVQLEIPIEDITAVQEGDIVTVDIYNNGEELVQGKVARISNHAVDIDDDSYVKVDVELTQDAQDLKWGSQLSATIELE